MRLGVAAGKFTQTGDRFADRRVPRKRFVPAAAALNIFQATVHGGVQPRGAALYNDAVGHKVAPKQQIFAIAQKIRHQFLQPLGQRLGILCRALALQGQQNHVITLGVNVDLQLLCLLVDLGNAQRAGGDLFKELAAGILLIFLPFLLKLTQIGFLLPLLVDFPADILQRFQKRRLCHRLKQILLHADLNGLLRKLKVVVSADENNSCLRQFCADKLAECQPVHKRHFDIRNQNVRAQLADLRQRQLAVGRIAAEFKTVPFPVDAVAQPFPHDAFVLYQKNLQQCNHLRVIVPFFPGV